MGRRGYLRFPTISGEAIAFVCEDDLWTVSAAGGRAERLTGGVAEASRPAYSPNGVELAFVGRDEGPAEVYVMQATGGPSRRLTYLGGGCAVGGWTPDGAEVVFASAAGQPFGRHEVLYAISPAGAQPRPLPYGVARSISFGPQGGVVLGRHTADPARWKRYRGGTAGQLWVDAQGSGQFQRLASPPGNLADPCWVGDRIYFLSDHEGVGNVYSCLPDGGDLRRHTEHGDYYARHLATDGQRLIYHAGTDLYLLEPRGKGCSQRLEIEAPSAQPQRNRKFVSAGAYLQSFAPHPQGHSVAMTTRGKAYALANWEGPVVQHGEPDGVRYRLLTWLNDGKRLVAVRDAGEGEALEVFGAGADLEGSRILELDLGRVKELQVSPTRDEVALTNHRNELLLVDLITGELRVMDSTAFGPREDLAWFGSISGPAWSPDGRWLAYARAESAQTTAIWLCQVESGQVGPATRPVLHDLAPAFDPEGNYLYFVGYREFDPVYDNLHFDLNFPKGSRPYAITLRRDLLSPFGPRAERATSAVGPAEAETTGPPAPPPVVVDREGIERRLVAFPVPEGLYRRVLGLRGKVLFTSVAVQGSKDTDWSATTPPANATLQVYDLKERTLETVAEGVGEVAVSQDGSTLIYRAAEKLRALPAGPKPAEPPAAERDKPGKASGWLDLDRVKVSVLPAAEWRQMYRETWRLQSEQFWAANMAQVDWPAVRDRYEPLLERVATRSELSDLLWEMQGELGTSHAYESGGEYRKTPTYSQGYLGADWAFDGAAKVWRVVHVVQGDSWDAEASSPLAAPGVDLPAGTRLLAINGQPVGVARSPQELLVNQAGAEVLLTVARPDGSAPRSVVVKALRDERKARYREWVERNRLTVYEAGGGRVGYIHVPDMGPVGFAEFHRAYLAEYDREALIIDVRWNGGGHVSPLLLEKLARHRVGYQYPRWGAPGPYPPEAPRGPLVALTNENAGSDGDIFSHAFKLLGLGPLVGQRTWGGVVGIDLRQPLADGTLTTQPEYAFWFQDVGWGVENYGTDPDIEVEMAPQDYAADHDPQLRRAVVEALRLIAERPAGPPDPGPRPNRAAPPLPFA